MTRFNIFAGLLLFASVAASGAPADTFAFAGKTDVPISTTAVSSTVSFSFFNGAGVISVKGGEYSVDNGVYTDTPGTISPSSVARVRHISSADYLSVSTTVLTVEQGGKFHNAVFVSVSKERPDSATASYQITFNANWSRNTHPLNFPSGRNPHFTEFIGGTHNKKIIFWEPGATASTGLENVAELGQTQVFNVNVNNAIKVSPPTAENVISFSVPAIIGSVSNTFAISQSFPLVSFASMLAPSPDWFVGVHDFPLYNDKIGRWINIERAVRVYDAGTEQDVNVFSLGNLPEIPHKPISLLTAANTDFMNGLPAVGTFTFTRKDEPGAAAIDNFSFAPITQTTPSALIESQKVAISGLRRPAKITVANGEYRINDGAYTSADGMIADGDTAQLRHCAPSGSGQAATTRVTIGGVSKLFASIRRVDNEGAALQTMGDNAFAGETLTVTLEDVVCVSTAKYSWRQFGANMSSTEIAVTTMTKSSSYRLSDADVGSTIVVVVSYTNTNGNKGTLRSTVRGPVKASDNRGRALISGRTTEGETLTATVEDSDGTANATIVYQWQRQNQGGDYESIAGAMQASYQLTQADVDSTIRVSVNYTDDGGFIYRNLVSTTRVIKARELKLKRIRLRALLGGAMR